MDDDINEVKLLKSADRAFKAQQLLENDTFKDAFAALEASYIEAWRLSPPMAADQREKLHLAINVLGKVKEHIGKIVTNGKLAKHELAMKSKIAA